MKRSEIQAKYKWDLGSILPSDEEWEKLFCYLQAQKEKLASYKGKLADKATLLECLKYNNEVDNKIEILFVYARMHRDEDGSVDKYVAMTDRAEGLANDLGAAGSYFMSELSSLSNEYLEDCISDPAFCDYDFMLKEVIRSREHILSDKEERILALSGKATGNYSEIFSMINNVEAHFPAIDVEGEQVQLTHGKYAFLMQHQNQQVRKTAFEAMYSSYKALINTIGTTYAGSVKKDNFYALVRGYDSRIAQSLDGDNVPVAVYDNLVGAVDENLSVLHRYVALRKKVLGVDELHMYDMHLPIVKNAEISVPYEEAYEMVLQGLAPLGEEYLSHLREARDCGWIDVMENEGKRSGAYSWGAYGSHPYVLLNYSNTTHDVFTIAHELGHALHSYYSDKALPYSKAQYAIFVAEVASTVNEVMLLKHLIATVKDKNVRKFLLSYYLDMFRTTLFRQTQFAQFEKITHEMEQNGESLTVKAMSDCYYELNKKYYGDAATHDDDIRYEWARIPHFYTSFYVYKYATGITSAINIVNAILSNPEYVDVYKGKFLSAGGSDSPYNILKNIGVDLATKKPYEVAMKEFGDTLALLEKEFEN